MNDWLRSIWSRCRAMVTRGRLDREFDEELTTHLELLVDEGRRSGMSHAEARRDCCSCRSGSSAWLRPVSCRGPMSWGSGWRSAPAGGW